MTPHIGDWYTLPGGEPAQLRAYFGVEGARTFAFRGDPHTVLLGEGQVTYDRPGELPPKEAHDQDIEWSYRIIQNALTNLRSNPDRNLALRAAHAVRRLTHDTDPHTCTVPGESDPQAHLEGDP